MSICILSWFWGTIKISICRDDDMGRCSAFFQFFMGIGYCNMTERLYHFWIKLWEREFVSSIDLISPVFFDELSAATQFKKLIFTSSPCDFHVISMSSP